MALPTTWNPVGPLARIDPFFDEWLNGLGVRPALAKEYERAMEMRLDVREDEDHYSVLIDLPGVKKTDIDVSVEGHQVSIRAEVNRDKSDKKGKQIHSERFSGQAYRSFRLPLEIDGEKATAAYDGGVLSLNLPKKNAAAGKRISVG